MIVGLGVTSCVAFERECGQMWLNPKGVVWWGVIVVPTSWRPEQPWCPLEGDTCPSNQQPAAHQYNSLRWHRVFVNETWTLSPVQFDGAIEPKAVFLYPWHPIWWGAKDKIAAARNKWILGANYSIRAVRPNSGRQRTNAIQHFGETGGNLHTSDYLSSRYP